MSTVMPGRFTADTDEPFVVFLIGMRVNRLAALRKWTSVARAMPPLIAELLAHPDKGCLGVESFFRFGPLTTILVSYWRSFEDLERFARSKDDPHLAAWREFNKRVGGDGTVGIWHETFLVPARGYEAVYANMPPFGLAKATTPVPAVGRRETARRRLGGEGEPAVPTVA